MNSTFFKKYFERINQCVTNIDLAELSKATKIIKNANVNRKKVIVIGNGGSAAMASHISVDLTKAAGVRSVNFNESDLLTCFANDYGFENVFSKAIEFFADENDVLLAISSSGNSANIINAAKHANKKGLSVITLSGFKKNNRLKQVGKQNFWADSEEYNVVEMTHHIWLVSLVEKLVDEMKKN